MGTRLVCVTPIASLWPHPLISLARGIRIIDRPSFEEADWRFWNLRRTEEETLENRTHWICVERDSEWINQNLLNQMAYDLRTAMLGFQLWAPVGWDGVVLGCQTTARGTLKVECVHLPEAYAAPIYSARLDLQRIDPAVLGSLIEGTLAAIASGFVPIVNPFRFLEIGLQTAIHHRRAGAVLWMMGLDGLLAAEKQTVFSHRLKRILCSDTRIFPADWLGRQPTYTVGDLASDMFDFRNLIAHGKEILQKYRGPIEMKLDPEGERCYGWDGEWSHGTLIIESTAFVLTACLRRMILDGLTPRLRSQKMWKRWLDSDD